MARTNGAFVLNKTFKRMLIAGPVNRYPDLKKLFIDAQATAEEQARRQPRTKDLDES